MSSTARALERIGRFRLQEELGRGGMGVVYRALGPDDTPVALKTLRDGLDEASRARFERESLVRVDHPNVVRVVDAGTDEEVPYIAFELLQGESLEQRLARGTMSDSELVDVLVQACEGVAAAHDLGVVHRDLKPANVFICADGTVKVLDFGVAWLTDAVEMTVTGAVLGTPAYLSPEQARGARELGPPTDVWALGSIAYRALAGHAPFDRGSSYATLLAILMEPTPPLRAHAPQVPSVLARLVERCLEKDASARWGDPRELAERLRAVDLAAEPSTERAPAMPEGEERLVAVLLAQGVREPWELASAIEARGGRSVPLVGRDVIGLFGAHATEGDEAVRAVEAGLAARHLADRVAVGAGRARSSGEGIAGAAVRAAERGCEIDLLGVAVDSQTEPLVSGRFTLEAADDGVMEVVGERPEPADAGPGRAAWDGPIVGRADELERLESHAVACLGNGRAGLATITGAPGVGKTRLCAELVRRLRDRQPGVRCLLGAAELLHGDTVLSVFGDALRRRARRGARHEGWPRIDEPAALAERRQAVARLVREAMSDPAQAKESARFLGVVCGVDMPENEALRAARQDPQLMGDRLRLAVTDWLGGLCASGPVVLQLEDVHWADPASIGLLERLLQAFADAPLFLLVTARSDWDGSEEALLPERDACRVRLQGLGQEDVGHLMQILGRTEWPSSAVASIAAASEGNPLFVEHLVRSLVDEGGEVGELPAVPLPLTVEAAIQARLDHLPAEEREVCKRASVLGRPFFEPEVAALGATDASGPLRSLSERQLLDSRAGDAAPGTYAFASALTSEVAYRTMTPEVRRELHHKAAEHLSEQHAPDSEEVARHYESGARGALAASWYARAAREAFERGDSRTVLRCSGSALSLGAPDEQRFELHVQRADAHRFLGEKHDWAQELELALEAATTPAQRARALTEKGAWLARAGRLNEAIRTGAEAVTAARASDDTEVLALALVRHAEAFTLAGRFAEAEPSLAEAEAIVAVGTERPAAKVAASRALLATITGDVGRAREAYEQSVRMHRSAGDLRRAVFNEQNLADVYNRVGAHAEAEEALLDALSAARRVGNRLAEGYVLANLGHAQAKAGRSEHALSHLEQAEQFAESSGDVRLALAVRIYRARALLAAGRPQEASREASDAAAEAERRGQKSLEALACVSTARAQLALDDAEAALTTARRAAALREELGGLEEDEAEVFLVHANALEATGCKGEAAEVRVAGRARVLELADRIGDAEWRRRFLEDVEAHRTLVASS